MQPTEQNIQSLIEKLRNFVAERDWHQFHSPKNLAMALSVEAAEIVEIFQWLTQEQSRGLQGDQLDRLADEIGDVMIYLTMLADRLGLDPIAAAHRKIEKNREKYPVDRARGNAAKYSEY